MPVQKSNSLLLFNSDEEYNRVISKSV